ncbi:MAG: hypothetical protein DCC75_12350, partial [Proteobacteria bacterium]
MRLQMRGSKGAIFVLMAISLVALFTVVALVVDLTSLYIARSKWKQNGDAACLAALDQYLITDGDISTRILAAQLRAQGFIGANTAQAGAFGGASVDTLHNQVNVIGVDQDDQPGAN